MWVTLPIVNSKVSPATLPRVCVDLEPALTEAVQRCIETAKRNGTKNLADEFIHEGERLATEKRELELEREKLKIDIRYREQIVTDATLIADTMKQFEHLVRKLPEAEQKELIRLLVRKITVNPSSSVIG